MGRAKALFSLLFLLTFALPAHACIWDYDTLRDEQRGLPGVFEILTGRYEQRSQFFYNDRIAKMQALLAKEPNNLPAIDNLAVALFRVGRRDEAIAVMQDKEKRFPDQYTTSSNLATFDMLSGNNAAAIPLLEKALRINPNAHFGREKYQLQLAKYLSRPPSTQPGSTTVDFLGNQPFDVRLEQIGDSPRDEQGLLEPDLHFVYGDTRNAALSPADQQAAMTAILGMICFGTDQSPDLFYALGNLLTLQKKNNLAVRAYARAIALDHPASRDIGTLQNWLTNTIYNDPPTDARFAAELAEGQVWARAYEDFTDSLIRVGKDAENDANFADFYKTHGQPVPPLGWSLKDLPHRENGSRIAFYLLLAVLPLAALIRVLRWLGITSRRPRSDAA